MVLQAYACEIWDALIGRPNELAEHSSRTLVLARDRHFAFANNLEQIRSRQSAVAQMGTCGTRGPARYAAAPAPGCREAEQRLLKSLLPNADVFDTAVDLVSPRCQAGSCFGESDLLDMCGPLWTILQYQKTSVVFSDSLVCVCVRRLLQSQVSIHSIEVNDGNSAASAVPLVCLPGYGTGGAIFASCWKYMLEACNIWQRWSSRCCCVVLVRLRYYAGIV